jgi:hypothetical protein
MSDLFKLARNIPLRWGGAHPALMAHQVLGDLPVLGAIFTITVPTGGDGSTVNVGHYSRSGHERTFASINAAAYRGLIYFSLIINWTDAEGGTVAEVLPAFGATSMTIFIWLRDELGNCDHFSI